MPPTDTDLIASFDRVSYLYPHAETFALKDVSLDIRRGEFLGLIGPTGAGKTTLCLACNGITPQSFGGRFFGHVTVLGLDTLEHPISHLARRVGMVFEDPETQLTATSVENEVAFALENLCVPREEIRARIPRVLAAVRLDGLESRHPHELSGGQKQRLAIAAALAVEPALLVLDEPTAQLDPAGAREVFDVVRELNRVLGMTVLLASHAAEALAEHADRVALLAGGMLRRVGTPGEIYGDVALLEAHRVRPPQVTRTFYLIARRQTARRLTARRGLDGDASVRQTRDFGTSSDFWTRMTQMTLPVCLDDGLARMPALRPFARFVEPPVSEIPPAVAPLIAVRNLTYRYEGCAPALNDITLDIHAGEYVLLVGQNGAGKSTLARHFVGLLRPGQGAVHVNGRDTREWALSDLASRIGYVAQNPDHQLFCATVAEEVAFALQYRGYAHGEIAARTAASLEAMGLAAYGARHPLSLPRGDRARVVIAAILAMQPEALIFDEPTTGQDADGAQRILDVSRELHRQGKTIVVITHHLHLAPAAARVIVMGRGVVLRDAPARHAFHDVATLRQTYLEPPQAVWLAQALFPERDGGGLLTPEEIAQCLH
ncbi:MAG: ATP-binding cassette domain-containing protein [Anaerolineae bacterium]|nr:ATP-binding cassette domain-containing protein [Anaerolineae bacterium]